MTKKRSQPRDLQAMVWDMIPPGQRVARCDIAHTVCGSKKTGGLTQALDRMVKAGMLQVEKKRKAGPREPSIFYTRPRDAVYVEKTKPKPPARLQNLLQNQPREVKERVWAAARRNRFVSVWDFADKARSAVSFAPSREMSSPKESS